jgi:hypothetical protein
MTAESITQAREGKMQKPSFVLPYLIGLVSGMAILTLGIVVVSTLKHEKTQYIALPTSMPTATIAPEESDIIDYLYIPEWGIKFAIPDGISQIEYELKPLGPIMEGLEEGLYISHLRDDVENVEYPGIYQNCFETQLFRCDLNEKFYCGEFRATVLVNKPYVFLYKPENKANCSHPSRASALIKEMLANPQPI